MQLTSKMTKAQKTKVVEGFNFERETGQSQYKYRNGTYNMEGGDVARRFNLISTIVTGKPAIIPEATVADFDRIVLMQAMTDQFLTMSAGKASLEESNEFGKKVLAHFA
ncbi:hypothetical protein OLCHANIL_00064 [Vibrio phage V05]|uniref:Uncharacterized protein n=1 Tax=Vibrio phage VH1_2019 TaxID=2686307 RepID=A0A6B9SXB1_9CAUD|nr:hypothetical protein VH12019_00117 [Vibrio phage VH1_2019]QIW90161.1 hypothetical protein OLCHANIL_00064 [Vibrio phage V05]WOL24797.1 hypothetical protein [Vibrio phage PG216]